MSGQELKDVDILKVNTINPNATFDITVEAPSGTAKMIGSSKAIVESSDDVEIICDLGSNVRLTNNLTLQGQTIFLDSNTGIIDVANANINNVDFITNPDQPIVITGSKIEMRSNPPNTGDVEIYTNLNMDGKFINNVTSVGSLSDLTILAAPTGLLTIGTVANHKYSNTSPNNGLIEQYTQRLEEHRNVIDKIDTVHIYDASGFNETVANISGFDYYTLNDNCTYIIHDQITVTNGFNFGINTSIKGVSTSASITFDESTKNIIGFRAEDKNLIIQDITVIGGGGHFDDTNVGLFLGLNFDTGGPAPFYGRNKRCLISGCNIVACFSLGKLQGFGTTNILSNFINGGGSVVGGIYTTHGLDVSDGLSFELRGNKAVLFKGAQASSTLKMINFVDSVISPVVLGINAVIITGNILHPRDQENAINFEDGALVVLGTISANTFIRTGGTAPLINYQAQTTFDNYNVKSIENFEISGNAGVIDSEPVLEIPTGVNNQISSATWIDLNIPITSIGPLDMSKRFALKFIATGVTGGAYTKGNYLESTTTPTIRGYIVDVQTVLTGTDIVYITDMNGIFPDLLGYREVDSTLSPTGISSTGLEIGNNSNNIELYYFDRDSHDIQFACQISYENDAKEKEINFKFSKDSGSGYIGLDTSIIQTTNPRQDRGDSCSLIHLVRMNYGDLIKIEYQYIDAVNTTINKINLTGK